MGDVDYWVNFLLDTPSQHIKRFGDFIFAGDRAIDEGNMDEAEVCYKKALMFAENMWGADHQNCAAVWIHLSTLYRKQSLFDKAVACENEGVRICSLYES